MLSFISKAKKTIKNKSIQKYFYIFFICVCVVICMCCFFTDLVSGIANSLRDGTLKAPKEITGIIENVDLFGDIIGDAKDEIDKNGVLFSDEEKQT